MEILKFKDVPFLSRFSIPFAANEKGLSEWLNSLAVLPNEIAAEKVLYAVQALAQFEGKADMQIRLLRNALHHLHSLTEVWQRSYLDVSQPLDQKPLRQIEFVVWNYLELARLFFAIISGHKLKLTKEQHVLVLYLCIEALKHSLLHISLSYQLPMEGFWSLCFEVYRNAEYSNLLTEEVSRHGYFSVYNPEASKATIEDTFKHLMLFYLSDMQQFRARAMLVVFKNLAAHSGKAVILSGYKQEWKEGVCAFNLTLDNPPLRIENENNYTDILERFIAPVAVAKSIYAALQQKSQNGTRSIDYDVMIRALNSLGLGRKRKFKRSAIRSECSGVLGLKQLIGYMQAKQEQPIDPDRFKKPAEPKGFFSVGSAADLDLVPAGDEVLYQMQQRFRNDVRMKTPLGKLIEAGTKQGLKSSNSAFSELTSYSVDSEKLLDFFKIQDTSAKGYGLVSTSSNSLVKVGDILGLIKPGNLGIEIGLIRRINYIHTQGLRLGVELIGLESELVYVLSHAQPEGNMWALFIPGVATIKQADSLVYSSSLMKEGHIVFIVRHDQKKAYRLLKKLQETSAVVHMELQAIDDQ